MLKKYDWKVATKSLLVIGLALASSAPALAQAGVSKVAPGVGAKLQRGTGHQAVRLRVRNATAFRQWVSQQGSVMQVTTSLADASVFILKYLSNKQLSALSALSFVEFVDVPNRLAHDERLLSGADLTVNGLRAVQRRYPTLIGQGMAVSIKENPLDAADLDLRGRLLNTPVGTVIESVHASIMATLIAGGGNSGPAGEGAARQAGIASSSYANLLPDANADLTRLGVSVQNHSYGTGIENYYGLEAQGYDQQTRQLPSLLHVFSSGNAGTSASTSGSYQGLANVANLTGQFKMSKNSLAVGATDALGQVAALSSRGPAYDGRVKPELVAYGDAGSSDASALGSGAALLVQQAYRDSQGGTLPPASLVKAALINSADDVGRPAVDFVAGFGQLNALGAVRTMLDGHFRTGSVAQDQEQTMTLPVPTGTQQLNITLAWTDPEATANAAQALVNDLDLEVLGPNSTRWLPWVLSSFPSLDSLAQPARRRADHLNNVEQVTLKLPAAGTYQLRVRGFAVPRGPQAFSLTYEVVAPGFEWVSPNKLRNMRPGEVTLLRWRYAGAATTGRLEYRPIGQAAWRAISASANLTQHAYSWAAPDTTTLAQVRMVVDNQTFVSDTFALGRPLPLRVGYVCTDETLLTWPATPGATQYQLYRLGASYLEPFQLVADTLLRVLPAQNAGQYFAVAPFLGGKLAERSSTINLAEAGVGCYIRSFLPRFPIADTAQLVLSLGTRYNLKSLQLQRLGSGGFQTIETLSPVTQLTTLFTDLTATIGLNRYRLLGQNLAGRSFVSDTVSVQLVRQGELLVFPIPVVVGQDLQVAGEPGVSLEVSLYDALGRLMRTSLLSGALNLFDTNGLRPGVYLLRATPTAGGSPARTRRVVLVN
jgi:hypothetical protein